MSVAVVTGAAGGIGQVIMRSLAEAGNRVYGLDLADSDIQCDVRDDESVRSAIAEVGEVDIVVHAAGVARDAVVWKLAVDDWDLVHAVNLRGAFLLMRHAIPRMRARGGSIVLVGSINGSRGKRGTSAYSASKAGLIGLARSVARETGRFGIRVNVVEPGWVRTPLTESLAPELRQAALAETALNELVEPSDVAAMVEFLASDRAKRVTGQVFRVDAGQFMG